jgi:hypothetical protein
MHPRHSGVLPIAPLLRIHAPAAFGRPAHQKEAGLVPAFLARLAKRRKGALNPNRSWNGELKNCY